MSTFRTSCVRAGGLILVAFDYGAMGVLGIAAIIASLIFHFFTIDPTQKAEH